MHLVGSNAANLASCTPSPAPPLLLKAGLNHSNAPQTFHVGSATREDEALAPS